MKTIPIYSVTQLKNSGNNKESDTGTANIRYCEPKDRSCGNEVILDECQIDWKQSFYDESGWKRLWTDERDVDFGVVHRNQLKVFCLQF